MGVNIAMSDAPRYVQKIAKILEESLPKDCAYVLCVQRDNEDSPSIVTTEEDEYALSVQLRRMAQALGGDA